MFKSYLHYVHREWLPVLKNTDLFSVGVFHVIKIKPLASKLPKQLSKLRICKETNISKLAVPDSKYYVSFF